MISKPRNPNAPPIKSERLAFYAEPKHVEMLNELHPILLSEWEIKNGIDINQAEALRRMIKMLYKIKCVKVEP